jgi:hypothetical protein
MHNFQYGQVLSTTEHNITIDTNPKEVGFNVFIHGVFAGVLLFSNCSNFPVIQEEFKLGKRKLGKISQIIYTEQQTFGIKQLTSPLDEFYALNQNAQEDVIINATDHSNRKAEDMLDEYYGYGSNDEDDDFDGTDYQDYE